MISLELILAISSCIPVIAILKLVYAVGRILQKIESRLGEHERRIGKLEGEELIESHF